MLLQRTIKVQPHRTSEQMRQMKAHAPSGRNGCMGDFSLLKQAPAGFRPLRTTVAQLLLTQTRQFKFLANREL